MNNYLQKDDNIFNLAKKVDYKQIVVKRNTWRNSWAIVHYVRLDGKGFGKAYGNSHFSNGTVQKGEINCAGCYQWKLINVLDKPMKVYNQTNTEKS